MSIGVGFYKDLDYEWDLCGNLVNPTQTLTQTGFVSSDNKDLANVFVLYSSLAPGYTGATGRDCGLVDTDGNDIGPKFVKKGTIKKIFDPLSISGCWLWLDANDYVTITQESNQVSTWTDKSLNGFTFNQSVAAQKPTYVTNSLNGLPTLAFARSSSQYLLSPYSQAKNFQVGTKSFAMFVVFKLNDATRNAGQASLTNLDTIFSKAIYGGNPGIIDLYRAENGIFFNMYIRSGLDLGNSTTDTNYQLLTLVVNRYGTGSTGSASMTMFRNGAQISTQFFDPDFTNLTNPYDMIVGAYNSTSGSGVVSSTSSSVPVNSYLNGNIAEILGYSYSLDMSSETRQKIEGYLAWKWGLQSSLPSTHLHYNAPVYTYTSTTNDTENTDIITNLISGVTPWGIYDAALWNPYTKILPEATGNGRNAIGGGTGTINFTNASGNGATAAIPCIYGDTTTTLTWPDDSIPGTTGFTMCAISRYTGTDTTKQQRILTSGPSNIFVLGHHGQKSGWVYWTGGNKTADNVSQATKTNWLVCCAKSSSNTSTNANTVLLNGLAKGITAGGLVTGTTTERKLTINGFTEDSDWALSYLIIYASVLTDAQMQLVSEKLRYYLNFGTMRTNWNTETILNLVPNKIPWGIYDASYFHSATQTLPEATGNFRNATGATNPGYSGGISSGIGLGNGATAMIPYIGLAGLYHNLVWPSGSIPANFTICAITRYNNNSASVWSRRILTSYDSPATNTEDNQNFWLGHHGSVIGSSYWTGASRSSALSTQPTFDNWLVSCAKTSSDTNTNANTVLMNGQAVGTTSGATNNTGTLCINSYGTTFVSTAEHSDCSLAYLIIYDSVLSDTEMKNVSTKLQNYLTYGTMLPPAIYSTSTTALYTTTINNLFTDVKPWAIYDASYYNYVTKTLVEARGSGRNAVGSGVGVINFKVENGNGTTASVPSIYGYTNSILTWPEDSFPTNFTVCCITRYTSTDTSKQRRILASAPGSTDFLVGHYISDNIGVFYNSDFKTSSTGLATQPTKTDWLISCVKSSSDTNTNANTVLMNGSAIGTTTGGTVAGDRSQRRFAINGTGNTSDWALSYLIIYNSVLTDAQMSTVSATLLNSTNYGALSLQTDRNTNLVKNLISGKTPWGIYDAAYYDFSTGFLPEAINGDIAKRAIAGGAITYGIDSGNGAINKVPYISGGVNSSLTWPVDSIPASFTICGIVRYTSSSTNQQRIFTTTANEFRLGHKAGTLGIAYWSSAERTATTGLSVQPTKTNWLVCSAKSSATANENTVLMNGSAIGTTTGGAGGGTLSINGYTGEKSEWAFTYLIIYNSVLTDAEITTVSTKLLNYITYGTMIPPSISYNAVTISANTTAILNLIPGVTPWGIYDATYYDAYNNRLPEARGNGRDATCTGTINLKFESGNGATGIVPSIYGDNTTTMLWPEGSVPPDYTMCSITRWTGSNKGSLLTNFTSSRTNLVIQGQWGNWTSKLGSYTYLQTHLNNPGDAAPANLTDWANVCTRNKTSTGGTNTNNIIINSTSKGQNTGGTTNSFTGNDSRMCINKQTAYTGGEGESNSNWALSYFVIYDSILTDAQMTTVSRRLSHYLMYGEFSLNQQSYPTVITPTGTNIDNSSFGSNVYIFKASGSIQFFSYGSFSKSITILAVGGGGGGGYNVTSGVGGGGGGGVVMTTRTITGNTTLNITIGLGGNAGTSGNVDKTGGTTTGSFTSGNYSSIIAGGGGGGSVASGGVGSSSGGSGGGSGTQGIRGGLANTSNENNANNGGNGGATLSGGGGGGGGAGTVGGIGTELSAGSGGEGYYFESLDAYYGGGGGGAMNSSDYTGIGGIGGGGGVGSINQTYINDQEITYADVNSQGRLDGQANTGGGGAGGGFVVAGPVTILPGKGGSGVFIVIVN